ncbi:pilus assembly protein [Methylophaga sp.]|uniref:pilus assembly protein n=1 Tax=Methylophaga sp. TaxID=2024840 RepID=UPI003A91A50C
MFRQFKAGVFTLGMLMVLPVSGWADDIDFSQQPLMAGGGVDPNLMFIFDDSGSMRWGFMPDDLDEEFSIGNSYQNCNNFGTYAGFNLCYYYTNNGRSFLASNYLNKVYYNPNVNYEPPLNSGGSALPNANYFNAKVNGFDSNSVTVNLSDNYRAVMDPYSYKRGFNRGFAVSHNAGVEPAFYFNYIGGSGCRSDPYKDSCYEKVVIENDLSGAARDAARQNFANWFSYYRTREMAAKSGIGTVFANADLKQDFRLGWGNINRGKASVDDAGNVRAVRQGVRPFEDVKADFISWLYGINASGSTPLQRALEGAGQYYENSKRAWVDDPSRSASQDNVARECRMSATMLMTDGYYNTGQSYNPDLTSNADNYDGDLYTHDDGTTGQYKAVNPFADTITSRVTLGDIAAHYWKRDLRDDIDNFVPVVKAKNKEGDARKTPGNPAFWQHMMTYGIGFGVEGTVSRDDAVAAVHNGSAIDWWGGNSNENKINDLLHASINGRGDFFSASDPESFRSELGSLLNSFFDTTGSATGLDFNVATIESDGALVFSSSFESNGWAGDLEASTYGMGDDGLPAEEVGDQNKGWSARDVLATAEPDDRVILTWDGAQGQPFRWTSLTSEQKADLNTGAPSLGEERLEYLRGKKKSEITGEDAKLFRERTYRLGSIVNSTPRFIGAPSSGWPNDIPGAGKYSEFYNANIDRTPVVYVGSNDGMLHGFKATDSDDDGGKELVAYVPSFISSTEANSGLHYLTQPDYDHRFYVDLNLEIVDIYTKGRGNSGGNGNGNGNGNGAGEAWRTLLIGGARAGAKGIFALDVTAPETFSEDTAATHVFWEFTPTNDNKLGYLVEPPEVALMDWGGKGVRWTAFVPNGYNSETSSTGFFMLDIEAGLDGWGPGDYKYHEFEAGSGLSPLTLIDTDADYIVDRVYAGDRDGNLWVADVTGGSQQTAYTGPYFKAAQPITSAPAVSLSADTGKDPDLMILFGTGQYLETSDNGTDETQYFYAVHETSDAAPALTYNDLVEINVTGSGSTRTTEDTRVDYELKRGWYTPLPTSGERIVNYPIIRGEYVYVNTVIPSTNPCLGGGYGWVMGMEIVRAKNTTPVYKAFKNLGETGAGVKVSSTPSQLSTWGNLLTYGTGVGGAGFTELEPFDDVLGRRGWREITE